MAPKNKNTIQKRLENDAKEQRNDHNSKYQRTRLKNAAKERQNKPKCSKMEGESYQNEGNLILRDCDKPTVKEIEPLEAWERRGKAMKTQKREEASLKLDRKALEPSKRKLNEQNTHQTVPKMARAAESKRRVWDTARKLLSKPIGSVSNTLETARLTRIRMICCATKRFQGRFRALKLPITDTFTKEITGHFNTLWEGGGSL